MQETRELVKRLCRFSTHPPCTTDGYNQIYSHQVCYLSDVISKKCTTQDKTCRAHVYILEIKSHTCIRHWRKLWYTGASVVCACRHARLIWKIGFAQREFRFRSIRNPHHTNCMKTLNADNSTGVEKLNSHMNCPGLHLYF